MYVILRKFPISFFFRSKQIFPHGLHLGEISCCYSQGSVLENNLGSLGVNVRFNVTGMF